MSPRDAREECLGVVSGCVTTGRGVMWSGSYADCGQPPLNPMDTRYWMTDSVNYGYHYAGQTLTPEI